MADIDGRKSHRSIVVRGPTTLREGSVVSAKKRKKAVNPIKGLSNTRRGR